MQKVFFPLFIILILSLVIAACSERNGNKKPIGSTIDSTSIPQPTKNGAAKEEFTPQLSGYYVGTIARNLNVQFAILEGSDSQITGYYFKESIGDDLSISGTCGRDGKFFFTRMNDQSKITECFRGKIESDSGISGIWVSAEEIKTFPFSLKKVAEFETIKKKVYGIDVTIHYPRFLNSFEGDNFLNEAIKLKVEEKEDYINKDIEYFKAMDGLPSEYGFYSVVYTIANCNSKSISLLITNDWYISAGQPHPNSDFETINYCVNDGIVEPLALPDLLKPGIDYVEVIGTEILSDLRRQDSTVFLDKTMTSVSSEMMIVWLMRPKRLIFIYAPYIVGSYSQGTFIVSIPAAKLKEYLNPQGLLQP